MNLHPPLGKLLVGSGRAQISDPIPELTAVSRIPQRRLEAKRFPNKSADGAHLVDRQSALSRKLFIARIANPLLRQSSTHALELVTTLQQVDRDANRLALVSQRPRHRLPHPPCCIGRESMSAPPIELLDRANQTELTFLHEVVHVEPLPDEAPSVGHNKTKVRSDELVHGSLGVAPTPGEGPPSSLVRAARPKGAPNAIEHRALEALGCKIHRHSGPAALAALSGRLVANDPRRRAGCGSLQHPSESLDADRSVGVLFGVSQKLRRQNAPIPKLRRHGAKRRGGVDGPQQRIQGVTLAGFDPLRKIHLLFVGQHPPARSAGGRRGGNGCRSTVVCDGDVGKRVQLERLVMRMDDLSSRGSRGCEGCA